MSTTATQNGHTPTTPPTSAPRMTPGRVIFLAMAAFLLLGAAGSSIGAAWLNGAGSLAIDKAKGLSFDLSVQGAGTASIGSLAVDQLKIAPAGGISDVALLQAGTLLATIPLLVLFIATGRQLVAGIMQGAVKG